MCCPVTLSLSLSPPPPPLQAEVSKALKPLPRVIEQIMLQADYGDDPHVPGHTDLVTDVVHCVFTCASMSFRNCFSSLM